MVSFSQCQKFIFDEIGSMSRSKSVMITAAEIIFKPLLIFIYANMEFDATATIPQFSPITKGTS